MSWWHRLFGREKKRKAKVRPATAFPATPAPRPPRVQKDAAIETQLTIVYARVEELASRIPRDSEWNEALGNFAQNLHAAHRALTDCRDMRGDPISRSDIARGLQRMCDYYSGPTSLSILGGIHGSGIRKEFEEILELTFAIANAISDKRGEQVILPFPPPKQKAQAPRIPSGMTAEDAKQIQQEQATKHGIPVLTMLDCGGGVSMKLSLIPAGKFLMGSPYNDSLASPVEKPQHEVTISKPFYMGVTVVTQAQWKAVMGTEPWKAQECVGEGENNVAIGISWYDATAFCKAISTKTDKSVRLPTEAEWEYACRAGTMNRYFSGDDVRKVVDYAWFNANSGGEGEKHVHQVAQKKSNTWRLFDMHGNVWEWCSDWFDRDYYSASGSALDPAGPSTGESRVLRGGSYDSVLTRCRSAARYLEYPDYRGGMVTTWDDNGEPIRSPYVDDRIGFRVVLSVASHAPAR